MRHNKMTQYPKQLATIEAHVRRRLRSRIVSQQKRRRHLYDKLVDRGVSRGLAAKTAYSNRWFIQELGQKILSDRKLPNWFSLKTWIKIT